MSQTAANQTTQAKPQQQTPQPGVVGAELAFDEQPLVGARLQRSPHSLRPAELLYLQRTAGNHAVSQLVQRSPHSLRPAELLYLQRTAGNHAVSQLVQRSPRPAPLPAPRLAPRQRAPVPLAYLQRKSENWDKFTDFAKGQGSGFMQDQEWWQDKVGEKKGLGAKVGAGIGVSPFALLQMGLSGVGRGLATLGAGAFYGAKGLWSLGKQGVGALGDMFSSKKKTAWDPLSGDQKGGMIGDTGPGALGGISSVGGGGANLISSLTNTNQMPLSKEMVDADPTLRGMSGDKVGSVSEVGQGFGAATGILGGIGGLANMGRGIGNIFGHKREGKGYQRLTRGVGRTGAGAAQTFAGMTLAGKSIANLAGAAGPAAQFMASAAVPAQAALSGIDLIKGTYGLAKATKRKGELRNLQKGLNLKDEQKGKFAQLAKQYQSKRQKRAGINIAAGVLGGLGAGLTLSGVGAPIGLALMAGAGALKFGGSIYGALRDRTWGKKDAEAKRAKEMDWAKYAAKNYKDRDIQSVLKAMGAEDNALDEETLGQMSEEERAEIMYKQLMKR